MSKSSHHTHKPKPGLVPTAGIYCVIALVLFLALGLVLTKSLLKISNLATTTRDAVLPAVLDRQRTAVNLERLGRFAEIIHRSGDANVRRQYKLAARILAYDSAFEENKTLNATALNAYEDIKTLSQIRDTQENLVEHYEEHIFSFMPATGNSRALRSNPNGAALIQLMVQADRTSNMADLDALDNQFHQIADNVQQADDDLHNALASEAELFALRRQILEMDENAAALWEKINTTLETVSANLSTKAAVRADEGFTIISDKANRAVMTSMLVAACFTASLLTLLFFAQRRIVAPILRSIEGLNRIGRGEKDISLPEERLLELDNIRLAVEQSSALMTELAETTKATEEANQALEREIFQRQKTQELLARAKERAEDADRAKSDFLAGMSHEIRTPMNTMIGMVELLLEEELPPKQRKYIETLRTSGSMLLGIINDILDISKIEAGEVELEIVDIDRDQFLDRTCQLVTGRAKRRGLDFVIDVDDDVPSVFRSDPTRLRQVLVNLIDNSVKFTEEGEIRLAIQRATLDGNEALTFAVIDTGIGIPEEAQKSIFHKFTQAQTSTTREYGGTGLGLSICQRLVELMGGTLKLESSPGQGTAFYFTLCLECMEKTAPRNIIPVPLGTASVKDLKHTPLSILVAEDSESNRALIDLYFKATACTIDFAENGREAIDKFSQSQYDLILMDIQMPGIDGYEATRHIRKMEQEKGTAPIPILAVTANAFKEDQDRSREAGCTDYLAKPVSKNILLERVALHAISNRNKDA